MGEANVYDIVLLNKSQRNQTYGWFLTPPDTNTGASVYSNVWISQNLGSDGSQEVKITKTFYAWCGKALGVLEPGVTVSIGNAKAVVLGTKRTKGTTCHMYNNGGSPAFELATEDTAGEGAFQIDSNSDFKTVDNFLVGMAAPDGHGRMLPVASFEASPKTSTQIKPHVDYWIAAVANKQGVAVDWESISRDAAHINFTAHPGQYGAVVTHDDSGNFDVNYTVARAQHLELKSRLLQSGYSVSPLEQKVNQMSQKLSALLKHFPNEIAAIEDEEGDKKRISNGIAV